MGADTVLTSWTPPEVGTGVHGRARACTGVLLCFCVLCGFIAHRPGDCRYWPSTLRQVSLGKTEMDTPSTTTVLVTWTLKVGVLL